MKQEDRGTDGIEEQAQRIDELIISAEWHEIWSPSMLCIGSADAGGNGQGRSDAWIIVTSSIAHAY